MISPRPAVRAVPRITMMVLLFACGANHRTSVDEPPPSPPAWPITGQVVPGLESYDSIISSLMKKYGIPGGAVAVVRNGKLVYARGFGYADVENHTPTEPDALFRIASVSKPITAAAILKLVEANRLTLDDRVAPYIAQLTPAPNATIDARWDRVTIRQVLHHEGGWDRDKSFDPMFRPDIAAQAVGAPAPASAATVIRYMKGVPFDFDPGDHYAYSNFGYAVLGRIIERVTGLTYEEYVRNAILVPVGAQRTRLGHTRLAERGLGEVRYYYPGQPLNYPPVKSVFPDDGTVPNAYGGFYLEAMDAHGGWVSSTIDLLRFVTSVDARAGRPDILSSASLTQMVADGATVCAFKACWYGLGWLVRPSGGDANWWHNGSLPGTTSIVVRSYHGYAWAALFNARTEESAFGNELDAKLWDALNQVRSWPEHDLFPRFP